MFLCRAQDEQHTQEVSRFQQELAEAHSQLQILQKQLDEELAKQPLTHQEVGILDLGQQYLADEYCDYEKPRSSISEVIPMQLFYHCPGCL